MVSFFHCQERSHLEIISELQTFISHLWCCSHDDRTPRSQCWTSDSWNLEFECPVTWAYATSETSEHSVLGYIGPCTHSFTKRCPTPAHAPAMLGEEATLLTGTFLNKMYPWRQSTFYCQFLHTLGLCCCFLLYVQNAVLLKHWAWTSWLNDTVSR